MKGSVWFEAPGQGAVARAEVRSAADVRAIECTPYRDLLPAWSILGVIEHWARRIPRKTAMVALEKGDPTRVSRELNYADLAATVRGTANRLRQVSAGAPPVVSILTPLLPEAFIASWAGASAGVANPINPFLRIEHVASIMNAAGTTVLVSGTPADGSGAWNEIGRLQSMVPTLREVWRVGRGSQNDFFRQQLDTVLHDELQFDRPEDPRRTAALLHTGGTTAAPKLVRHTEEGQLLNAWCCGTFNDNRPNGVAAVGMPYFHVGGAVCLGLAHLVFGQTSVIVSPDGFRDSHVIERFWDLVEAHGVTIVGSAPTSAAAIVATPHSNRPPKDFRFWSGGAAVPVQLAREFAEKFGIPLHEGWGMTEVQGGLILNPCAFETRIGSVGILLPYHRARCVKLGARTADIEAPPGVAGVLAVKGPCVTEGYLDAAHTPGLFFESSITKERWINSGDLCTIDPDEYFWHRGRSKDLIIRGGHNIDPIGIEEALLAHPAVLYAAAIGEPDRDKGEMPVAYVQLRSGASASDLELIDHCRDGINERAAVPRSVRIVETMPLTAVGKIFKPALRQDAVRRCVEHIAAHLDASRSIDIEVRETGGVIVVALSSPETVPGEAVDLLRRELERYTLQVHIEHSPLNGDPPIA